jgi:hypothetical protein
VIWYTYSKLSWLFIKLLHNVSKAVCNRGVYFSKGRSAAMTFMSSDFARL